MIDVKERAPFGVEHIKAVCAGIHYPPRMAKKGLKWGFRLNRPDLVSTHDYRWPFPGNWAEAAGPILDHGGECCNAVGDGICAAHTLRGACSNGARIGSSVGLLVAWTDKDVLGGSADKIRLRRAWVAEIFDPIQAILGANLRYADLGGANLGYANLRYANLGYADLGYANLGGANLRGADLRYANLGGANLGGANLGGANLRYANLRYANLGGANLGGANLGYAKYNQLTLWPDGYDPQKAGATKL